ncbi:MAG TPA: 2-C-methyl-D-erythritol 4-phosphate cytidylyltransferase [Acetobacteraceae bacterium]|nr:2-C-methyl-D-erythritol 4-phosphate cytidylyltransferase [Acetobacteraceae bacterium]
MTAALIVGAGRGTRLGGPIPKQYRMLGGLPVLRHTLLAFLRHPAISRVQAVIHADDAVLYAAAAEGLDLPPPVLGGATRQESVWRGLERLAAECSPTKVLIHDAVRPFVAAGTIDAVITALDAAPAVIAGLPVPDTLKRCENGVITATVDRANLWRAQTPQGFRFEPILAAHRAIRQDAGGMEFTDDSLAAEWFGMQVRMVPGSEDAFKITTEPDLIRAEDVLARHAASAAG